MYFKKIVKNIIHVLKMNKWKKYAIFQKNSYYSNHFRLEIRHPENGKRYFKSGHNNIIEGHFVFEREFGQVIIGDRVHIGNSTFISINSIEIGNDVTIAWNCTFYDHNSHAVSWDERKNDTLQEYIDFVDTGDLIRNKNWNVVKSAPIKICDKVWIGLGVTILKGVTIGEGAVVAACSVVTKDVLPYTVVAGNPAQFVKEIKVCK